MGDLLFHEGDMVLRSIDYDSCTDGGLWLGRAGWGVGGVVGSFMSAT